MKILFTGNYDTEYNRTLILKSGLESKNIEYFELPIQNDFDLWQQTLHDVIDDIDVVFIPPFAHRTVKLIKKNVNKKIIFDPLVSRFMSKVYDFKKYPPYSPRAIKHFIYDQIAFKNSDIVLTDTESHLNYFHKTFRIPYEKFRVLHIGVDTEAFYPKSKPKNSHFKIGFYGSFLPLQGVPAIIKAAKILSKHEDIVFELVGSGWRLAEAKAMVKDYGITNVKFLGWLDYNKLNDKINEFDVCLGIFGDSVKADIVVPNKAYHYSACKKCMITKETTGIKEIFTDEKDAILTNGTYEDLADKLLYLYNNDNKRNEIACNAYDNITSNYNQKSVADRFISIINDLIQ
ncbi:glycosyltransferase [Bacteroidota bacterium]